MFCGCFQLIHIPFTSALLGDCIKKGMDAREGGVRYPQFLYHIADRGLQDVADSLAAIQKLVFDDKKINMKEMLDAVSSNFEGNEKIRTLLKSAPKYGNDDDYVDDYFSDLSLWLQERLGQEKKPVWFTAMERKERRRCACYLRQGNRRSAEWKTIRRASCRRLSSPLLRELM